jgi:4,5:9,10-diseco-3-hydroxy-5,9,17-trioxoandrosta-1(10),2-diene-4-oate hydrolase
LNVRYLHGGRGDPLVIVHGGGGGTSAWRRNLELLSEHYSVYAPDLPGFGSSEPMGDRFRVSEYVGFLDDFTGSVGLGRFYLLGHSVGGGIALKYALEFPRRVEKLVLVSSLFLGEEIALWARYLSSLSVLGYAAGAFLTALSALEWFARLFCASCRISPPFSRVQMAIGRSVMTVKGQTIVLLDQLAGLVVPTLLVWGARDGIVPPGHAYAAADVIPDCRIHIFEDCGHQIHNRKQQPFSQLLTAFLEEHPED